MSRSVVQKIGVPPAPDGGGLAAVITSLTDAVTIDDDVRRHDALRDHPVTGEHSLLYEVLGAALNAARTAYALILEFLDVSAVSDPVLGDSRALNLEAFFRPDAVPALVKRIEERAQIGYGLSDKLPQIVAESIVAMLTRNGISTEDIITFADHYGASDETWNGIAAKQDFSANIFSPLAGLDPAAPVHLGHDEMAQLRLRILEFLATIWKQFADNLLLGAAPSFQPSTDALTLLQHTSQLENAMTRMLRGDGLVRCLASDYDIGDILVQPERLYGGRSHPSATWIVQGDRLCRFQHKAVVHALRHNQRVCPEPDLTLQCEAQDSPYHLDADARVMGSRLLLLFLLRQFTREGDLIRTWQLGSLSLSALDDWTGDSISVSADDIGVDASDMYRFNSKPIWVDGGYYDVPLVLDQSGTPPGFIQLDNLLYIELNLPDGIELAESNKVFTLSTGLKEGRGSHVLLVLENGSRLLIGQQTGGGGPWWDGSQLEWVADARLRGPAFALCAVNDQIIINDQSNDRWAFLPFRALVSESLWKPDEVDVFGRMLGSRSRRMQASVVPLELASDHSPATVHTDLLGLARPVITRADITGSTADDLKTAASAAAEALNPAPTAEETAAYNAAKAVSDAAQDVVITTKVGVKDAITAAAANYPTGPEHTAAASVVQAVTDPEAPPSNADDLKAAASAAAEELNPAPTVEKTAIYDAALAVSDAAKAVDITQKIGVKDAVTAAAAAYTEGPEQTAAASVVQAVIDADITSSTTDDLKTVVTAGAYTAGPEQTAVASVVQAVTAADIAGSTADDLKTMASDAAELYNPAPTADEIAIYNAALAVSAAANAESGKGTIKTAASAAAANLTNPTEAEQTAADSVAQAVTDADITGSTVGDLKTAASAAAEMLNPAPTAEKTAIYEAALAVSDAAQAVDITSKIGVRDAVTTAATTYTEGPELTAAASVVQGVTDIERGLGTITELLVDETYGETTFNVNGLLPDGTAVDGTFTYGMRLSKVGHLMDKITALYQGKAVASLKRGRIVLTDTVGGDSLTSLKLTITRVGSTTVLPFRVVEEGGDSGMIITSKDGYEGPSGDGVGPDFNEGIVYDIDGGNGDSLISIIHSESEWLELYNCYNSPVPEHVRSFDMGTGTSGTCQIAHELWGRVLFTDTVLTTGGGVTVTDPRVDLNDLELFHGGLTPATGTLNITGTKPDGTEVSTVFTYDDDGKTVGDLLDRINVAYEGHVVSTLEEGRITILDDERGLSQTSLILSSESDITLPDFVTVINPTERVLLISTRDNRIEYHAGVLSDVQLEVVETREAASSDEDAFTVTAGSEAPAGSHDIEFSRLATADARVSRQYVSTDSDFTSVTTDQSFEIIVAHPTDDDPSNTVEIPVMESADTFSMTNLEVLEKVANDINTAMSTAVITGEITADEKAVASVEPTESGMNRLVVASGQTGETNALQLNDPDGLLTSLEVNAAAESAGTSGGYIKPASELNAQITVDGESFTRGSNLIEDVLEDASIQLLRPTTATETITVTASTSTEKTFGTMTRG